MIENIDLYKTFIDDKLDKFVEALDVYQADPNSYVDETGLTVFEIVLSTPKSADYIQKCIEFGADFYVQNDEQKYPIHYVIESKSVENLKAVEKCLWKKKCNDNMKLAISSCLNVKNKDGKNSLHLLLEYINYENSNEIIEMIKILLLHGCNLNSPNNNQETPYQKLTAIMPDWIIRSEFEPLFSKSSEVDVTLSLHDVMLNLLEIGDINQFETKFCSQQLNNNDEISLDNKLKYLEIAIEKSLNNIVGLLINKDIDLNKISEESNAQVPPLFLAYQKANVGIFKSLLMATRRSKYSKNSLYWNRQYYLRTLLLHFFYDLQSKSKKIELTIDQRKCFDLLLNDSRCDVKYLNMIGKFRNSAIYYSVGYGIDYMTIKLLEKGAFIGSVITKIRKSLFEEFLDSCVTSNDEFHDNNDFVLSIDYKFLMPISEAPENRMKKRYSIFGSTETNKLIALRRFSEDIVNDDILDMKCVQSTTKQTKFSVEMHPLKTLVENNEYKHFIMHPVLASFVLLKWKKIGLFLYLNLLLTLIFVLTFIPFIAIHRNTQESEYFKCPKYTTLFILSCISLMLLVIRELIQFLLAPSRYFKMYSNYIDIAIITSTIIILSELVSNREILRMLRAFVILLSTWECFNLLGYLPIVSISLHIKMFKKVFMTFLQSLAFYSVIILGFALSFYSLHGDKIWMNFTENKNVTDDMIESPTNTSRSDRFNNFYSIRSSIIKTFVMMTGELDASNIYFEGYAYIGLFIFFLFVVTIVLYNLLNALAVSDTQAIVLDAKLINLSERILLMYQHELNIFNRDSKPSKYFQKLISLFPDTILNGKIYLKPNSSRNILKFNDEEISTGLIQKVLKPLALDLTVSREIIESMCNLLIKKKEAQAENSVHYYMKFIQNYLIKINDQIDESKKIQMRTRSNEN